MLYEVITLLLDSAKVLNSDNLFKKDYRNLFDTGKGQVRGPVVEIYCALPENV